MTFQTRIKADVVFTSLQEMARIHARCERKLFAAIVAGKFNNGAFKQAFCTEHNLSSRQFNTMRVDIEGKIEGVKACLVDHQEVLESNLKTLKKQIIELAFILKGGKSRKGRVYSSEKLALKGKSLHEKKRKIDRLEFKVAASKSRADAKNPGICFGSRKLFREQFKPNMDKKTWLAKWQSQRDSQVLFIGSRDEEAGCVSCQGHVGEGGEIKLRVRPFNSMLLPRESKAEKLNDGVQPKARTRRKTQNAISSDYLTIDGLHFNYGHDYVSQALINNQSEDKSLHKPMTWRFVWSLSESNEEIWHVYVSFEVGENVVFDTVKGCIGIDFNQDHIAATLVDLHGNFVVCRRFPLNMHGKCTLRSKDEIRCAAKEVVAWAKELSLPVVGEDLDFKSKKRTSSATNSKRRNRQLSSLHYSSWGSALRSRCLREGVALKLVNAAFTSQIGRVKFAARHGLSIHHAAAMAIARRGMCLSERLPALTVRIPDGIGSHVTLDPAVSMDRWHVWKSWGKMTKAVNGALAAQRQRKSYTSEPRAKNLRSGDLLTFSGGIPGPRPVPPVAGRQLGILADNRTRLEMMLNDFIPF